MVLASELGQQQMFGSLVLTWGILANSKFTFKVTCNFDTDTRVKNQMWFTECGVHFANDTAQCT